MEDAKNESKMQKKYLHVLERANQTIPIGFIPISFSLALPPPLPLSYSLFNIQDKQQTSMKVTLTHIFEDAHSRKRGQTPKIRKLTYITYFLSSKKTGTFTQNKQPFELHSQKENASRILETKNNIFRPTQTMHACHAFSGCLEETGRSN